MLRGMWVLSLSAGIGVFPVDWSLVELLDFGEFETCFLSHV